MSEDVWKALADPTRRAILDRLKEDPRTTGALCEAFPALDRCTVMKHLEVLVQAHLVVSERRGRQRFNHLNPAPLQEIVERWVKGHTSRVASAALRFRERVERGAGILPASSEGILPSDSATRVVGGSSEGILPASDAKPNPQEKEGGDSQ